MRRRYHKVLHKNVRKHGKRKWEKISILLLNPENPLKMELSPAGAIPQEAKGGDPVQVLKSYANASLVQLHLETGRTHQIRVHGSAVIPSWRYSLASKQGKHLFPEILLQEQHFTHGS